MIPQQMPLPHDSRRKLRMRIHTFPDTKKCRSNLFPLQKLQQSRRARRIRPIVKRQRNYFPPAAPLQIAGMKNCQRINPIPPTKIGTYTAHTPATAHVHFGIGNAMKSTDAIPTAVQVTTP